MAAKITWIGQGGFLLTLGDKKICVDPYLSNSVGDEGSFNRIVPVPVEPKDLKVDLIITTHDHMDHLDEATLKYTDWENIQYAGPDSCTAHFEAMGILEKNVLRFNREDELKVGDALFHGVYAHHTEDSIGIVVEYDGVTMYIVGDSEYDELLLGAKRFNIDIILCCINGKLGNMDYMDAAKLTKQLRVKAAVPCHYGMFKENTEDPENYREALKGSPIKYFEMEFNREYDIKEVL